MNLTEQPWKASAKTRKQKLKRFARGPRKKPPDKEPPPLGRKKTLTVSKAKRSTSLHSRRDSRYKRCRRAISNPLCGGRAKAPFLAGSRRCYHRISTSYRHHSSAAAAPSHGYIPIIGTLTQNFTQSRCVSLFLLWFASIIYNLEVIYTSHRLNILLYGAIPALLLDWTLILLKPCAPLNACGLIWHRLSRFSNFGIEKPTFFTHHRLSNDNMIQIEKPVSRFSFIQLATSVSIVWAIIQQLLTSPTTAMSNSISSHSSSIDLLQSQFPNNNSPVISIDSNFSIASKPFYTRTSSLADDETTLCPSIPTSICFRELDDITVGSGPSSTIFHCCNTQKASNMSINNTDDPPINHKNYDNRPPSPDLMRMMLMCNKAKKLLQLRQ